MNDSKSAKGKSGSGSYEEKKGAGKEGKESYPALAKRYGLPPMEEIGLELDIPELGKAVLPLNDILKKILDKLEWATQILEPMMQTESFSGMMEMDAIPESRKKDIMILYREMMLLFRQGQIELLSHDPEQNAAFIKQFLKLWPAQKERLKGFIALVRDSWKSAQFPLRQEPQKGAGYFG